ncbi:MAG: nucleotidyltransferase [Gammaproteobacteria bacterium]|nr:MAG: nucleotidyltransferase [Gammaproteobacteria bacterium]
MTDEEPIRWKQRLQNYQRALARLRDAVELAKSRPLSELERQGLIQAFEFTHELAWKLMKDYLLFQGHAGITGSRDATREFFAQGLISNGQAWMDMIRSRNLSSHTYNEGLAREIADKIVGDYAPLLEDLLNTMQGLAARDDHAGS